MMTSISTHLVIFQNNQHHVLIVDLSLTLEATVSEYFMQCMCFGNSVLISVVDAVEESGDRDAHQLRDLLLGDAHLDLVALNFTSQRVQRRLPKILASRWSPELCEATPGIC